MPSTLKKRRKEREYESASKKRYSAILFIFFGEWGGLFISRFAKQQRHWQIK